MFVNHFKRKQNFFYYYYWYNVFHLNKLWEYSTQPTDKLRFIESQITKMFDKNWIRFSHSESNRLISMRFNGLNRIHWLKMNIVLRTEAVENWKFYMEIHIAFSHTTQLKMKRKNKNKWLQQQRERDDNIRKKECWNRVGAILKSIISVDVDAVDAAEFISIFSLRVSSIS